MAQTIDVSKLTSYAVETSGLNRVQIGKVTQFAVEAQDTAQKAVAGKVTMYAIERAMDPDPDPTSPKRHRFWRIHGRGNMYDGYSGVSDIIMRDVRGGPNICVGGTPFTRIDVQDGSAANAFDNNAGTFCQFATLDAWIAYDFGHGNYKEIVEVGIMPDKDQAARTWSTFSVEWSDDSFNWTPVWYGVSNKNFPDSPQYTYGAYSIFSRPRLDFAPAKFWRVFVDNNPNSNYNSISEMDMRQTPGGDSLIHPGIGPVPTIVQYASVIGNAATVTLPAPATPGNLLIAVGTHWRNSTPANAGWTEVVHNNGVTDDGSHAFYRVAQPGDQVLSPYTTDTTVSFTVYEVSGGNFNSLLDGFAYDNEDSDGSASASMTILKANSLLLGNVVTGYNNTVPTIGGLNKLTSITGTTGHASPRSLTPVYGVGQIGQTPALTALGSGTIWAHYIALGPNPPSVPRPQIVQVASTSNKDGVVTFDEPTTPGNVLVALNSHWDSGTYPNVSWNLIWGTGASHDGFGAAYHVSRGEQTVNPFSMVNGGTVCVFELSGARPSSMTGAHAYTVETTDASTSLTATQNNSLFLGQVATYNSAAVPSFTGMTQAGPGQAGRSDNTFRATVPAYANADNGTTITLAATGVRTLVQILAITPPLTGQPLSKTWYNNDYQSPKAFDQDNASIAHSAGDYGWWIEYQFPDLVIVNEFTWRSRQDCCTEQNPLSFYVQSSNDGINYTTRWVATSPGWSTGQTQTFTNPVPESFPAAPNRRKQTVVPF